MGCISCAKGISHCKHAEMQDYQFNRLVDETGKLSMPEYVHQNCYGLLMTCHPGKSIRGKGRCEHDHLRVEALGADGACHWQSQAPASTVRAAPLLGHSRAASDRLMRHPEAAAGPTAARQLQRATDFMTPTPHRAFQSQVLYICRDESNSQCCC